MSRSVQQSENSIAGLKFWSLQNACDADKQYIDYAHRFRRYTTIEEAIEIGRGYQPKKARKTARRKMVVNSPDAGQGNMLSVPSKISLKRGEQLSFLGTTPRLYTLVRRKL